MARTANQNYNYKDFLTEGYDIGDILDVALQSNKNNIAAVSDSLSSKAEFVKKAEEIANKNLEAAEVNTDEVSDITTFSLYKKQAALFPLLTREEELDVCQKVAAGDKKAREKLIESNLRLVISNALKYRNQGIDILDLIQNGNLGLINAADKFDFKKGYRFSTYATWWILREIRKTVAEGSSMIKTSAYLINKTNSVRKVQRDFIEEQGRAPSDEELSMITGYKINDIKRCINPAICLLTLDNKMSEDSDDTYIDVLKDVNEISIEEKLENEFLKNEIETCLDKLDDRERYVLDLFYGFSGDSPMNCQKIGNQLGLTREMVRQIKNSALEKISKEGLEKLIK